VKKIHLRKQLVAIILIAIIAVSAPLLSSCMPKPPEEVEPIKIGFPYPMVGAYAADGQEMWRRITIAVDDINAAGGLLGRPVEIVPADTKEMMPEDVVTAFKFLSTAGVDVFITDYAGEPADVHAAMVYDIPYFSWNDSRTAERAIAENIEQCDNVLRVSPSGREYATIPYEVLTDVIPYEYPNKKIAILLMDYEWNIDIAKDLREVAAADPEWEIVIDETHPYGATEYGSQLIRIREENPGLIFFITFAPVELVSFMEQFLEDPTDSIVYNPYTPCIPEFLELLGEEKAEGLFWGDQCSHYGAPLEEEFNQKFEERWGYTPRLSLTYDTVMLWAEAVKRAGDPSDYEAVLQAAIDYPYEGIAGTYKINPVTHVGTAGYDYIPHRFFQIQDGRDVMLFLHDKPFEGTGRFAGSFEIPPWIGK